MSEPDHPVTGRRADLRNIAIIAHVDHGKTTLVDAMLRQSGAFRANQKVAERVMDSGDLERERGITILAKTASVTWGTGESAVRINIVDTPGHADFGGEVERILQMVDGVILLVDAAEGPLPQTKFVTSKALALGLRPILLINKVDRADARAQEVHNEVFDLFAALGASDEQLDFPTLFASARQGWAVRDPSAIRNGALIAGTGSLNALFETVLQHVPPPQSNPAAPFAMLASILDADPYIGRILIGRIASGSVRANDAIKALTRNGDLIETGRATKLFSFRGIARTAIEHVEAGDIIAIAGLHSASVSDTLCAPEVTEALQATPIDPPVLAMTFGINDSPLAGKEGSKVTSRVIRDRLLAEASSNVAIKVTENPGGESFEVSGRGELQLGVLIETMRREGFELTISRPRVLFKTGAAGERLEPIEEVVIDVDEEFSGVVIDKMSRRKGEMTGMKPAGAGKTRITFLAPARGLIGYHGEFLADTRGTGVVHRLFHAYGPERGELQTRTVGVQIANGAGESVAYALFNLQDRGPLFVGAGEKMYVGMIIGEHNRGNDIIVNPLKGKKLTNVRAAGKDEAVRLTTPKRLTLEQAIVYVNDDECVEVTPQNIRLRKRFLDPHERRRAARESGGDLAEAVEDE